MSSPTNNNDLAAQTTLSQPDLSTSKGELLHYSFTAEQFNNKLRNYASLGASSMEQLSLNPTNADQDEVV